MNSDEQDMNSLVNNDKFKKKKYFVITGLTCRLNMPRIKHIKKNPTKLRFKEDSKKNNNLDLTGYRAHRTVYNRTI